MHFFSILTVQYNASILVSVASDYTPAALTGVNVKYDDVKHDPGNNFNVSTYEYRAPVTGQYLVASHLMYSYREGNQIILINGVAVAQDHMYSHNEPYVVTEPAIILRLNAGDRLSVQKHGIMPGNIVGEGGGMMRTWLSVALLNAE